MIEQILLPEQPSLRQIMAPVHHIPPPPEWSSEKFLARNRLEQLALSCTARALVDSGLWDQRERLQIGLVLGIGAEFLRLWELDNQAGGNRLYQPQQDGEAIVHIVRHELGLSGPATTLAAACASGGFALALGRHWVRLGLVDLCLAGSCDLITPMAYAGFRNLRALSQRECPPQAASRPFDRHRDGFVMGEGGAVFVLEPALGARRRGAPLYAELAGFGASSDAAHMVTPSTDPEPASRAIRLALQDAQLDPQDLDYVNAHATSTPIGDRAEAAALQLALGSTVAQVPVSSTKSMTGHLLSGAAAVEALACLVALHHQAIPPTINLDEPDPLCQLDHVPHHARERTVRAAASNSFGFGGANTCVVLRKVAA